MQAGEISALALRAAERFGYIVATLVQTIIRKVQEEDPSRGGGCLVIADAANEGIPIFLAILGAPNAGKLAKYVEFAQEKAVRLALCVDHIASWQSRDETARKYGGAIRVGEFIVSFSGLPERWDEVLCFEVARSLALVPEDYNYLENLRKATGNELLPTS